VDSYSKSRPYIEFTIGLLCSTFAFVTACWPDWVELIFGVDPDDGNGALEWGIVALLAATSVVLVFLARHEWKRLVTATGSRISGDHHKLLTTLVRDVFTRHG